MALTQRLEFRQSQSLVMTPQLMQAIKLLQLSNLDLAASVEEELERNPLLDGATSDVEDCESAAPWLSLDEAAADASDGWPEANGATVPAELGARAETDL